MDPTDLSQVLSSENIQNVENSEDAEALNQTNYFYESRRLREQARSINNTKFKGNNF